MKSFFSIIFLCSLPLFLVASEHKDTPYSVILLNDPKYEDDIFYSLKEGLIVEAWDRGARYTTLIFRRDIKSLIQETDESIEKLGHLKNSSVMIFRKESIDRKNNSVTFCAQPSDQDRKLNKELDKLKLLKNFLLVCSGGSN